MKYRVATLQKKRIFTLRKEIIGIGKDFVEYSNEVRTWSHIYEKVYDSFGITGPFQVVSNVLMIIKQG